jgi:putative tryptophan/tyrosine transport system substrate-binding protein
MIRRREFITLLGGAAAGPVVARAQQQAMPVIGFLDSRSPEPLTDRLRGFRQGLKDGGYVDGENVAIVYRWAENQLDRLPQMPVAGFSIAAVLSVSAVTRLPCNIQLSPFAS